jgi:hypothetical protein
VNSNNSTSFHSTAITKQGRLQELLRRLTCTSSRPSCASICATHSAISARRPSPFPLLPTSIQNTVRHSTSFHSTVIT